LSYIGEPQVSMIPTARVFVKTNFLLANGHITGTIMLAFQLIAHMA